jgi:seryl-tRNA synthetase
VIDIKRVREAPADLQASLARRDPALVGSLKALLELDARRRSLLQRVESLKAERNVASGEVARLKKDKADASEILANLKKVSNAIKELDKDVKSVDEEIKETLLRIPNVPLDDVPAGDASANIVERSWGTPPEFSFPPLPHWELGKRLDILDLDRGAKITGSGFPVFTGLGARLVRGLINFMLELHVSEHGYREIWPPALVNADSAFGTGQLPDLESNMYVTEDGLYLCPTAEVPVTNLHRDELLSAEDLPIGYAAYTPCFRREAGAHGKDTRGVTRVHQFDKVELVRFSAPEESATEHELLLSHAETVLQRLKLPYRVVVLATGDLGFASAKTYDLEVWAPGVGAWLEVSSASTFTDFQARRANIRYRPRPGAKPVFVHTLNASGLALPRTIIALLENNQQEDGSVRLPETLVPFVGAERLELRAR